LSIDKLGSNKAYEHFAPSLLLNVINRCLYFKEYTNYKIVNEKIYNLAYGFLSRTYLAVEINNKRSNSHTKSKVENAFIKLLMCFIYPANSLIKDDL